MEFKLRRWDISDLDSLVKYANNWNIAKNMTNKFPHPYTASDGKLFIEFATKDNPIHIFAIDINGEAVGGIGIHPQTDIFIKNAELGYWLAEPYWGQKIISKAIQQMIDFGFSTYDIDRIFARPFGTNIPSQKILEKNNFILEGRFENILFKDGQYIDELVYAIRRENWKR
ncbi:MAG: GNAT family N-acetyltransferase [Bacteroidetes bacterium]|nr:GNAT family N-acetyltransferase [Bacteroidota bacterium]